MATIRGFRLVAVAVLVASAFQTVCAAEADPATETSPPPSALVWLDYREAKAISRNGDMPMLIHFTSSWSRLDGRLRRETWSDRRVVSYLSEHFVVVQADISALPTLAQQFDVSEPATLWFVAPDGRRLTRMRGFAGPEKLLRVAEFVATKAYEFTDYDTWLARRRDR